MLCLRILIVILTARTSQTDIKTASTSKNCIRSRKVCLFLSTFPISFWLLFWLFGLSPCYVLLKRKINLSISAWNIWSTQFSDCAIALVMNGFAFVHFILIDRRIAPALNHFLDARHAIGSNGALCGFVPSWTYIAYFVGLNSLQYHWRNSDWKLLRKRHVSVGVSMIAFLSNNTTLFLIEVSSVFVTTSFENEFAMSFNCSVFICISYIIRFLSMLKQHEHDQ